jgi:hypothetical protein
LNTMWIQLQGGSVPSRWSHSNVRGCIGAGPWPSQNWSFCGQLWKGEHLLSALWTWWFFWKLSATSRFSVLSEILRFCGLCDTSWFVDLVKVRVFLRLHEDWAFWTLPKFVHF